MGVGTIQLFALMPNRSSEPDKDSENKQNPIDSICRRRLGPGCCGDCRPHDEHRGDRRCPAGNLGGLSVRDAPERLQFGRSAGSLDIATDSRRVRVRLQARQRDCQGGRMTPQGPAEHPRFPAFRPRGPSLCLGSGTVRPVQEAWLQHHAGHTQSGIHAARDLVWVRCPDVNARLALCRPSRIHRGEWRRRSSCRVCLRRS